ncbi:hypothetical protein HN51_039865 [Arachis hypogaea]|uniref:Uncharacterized protein n=2 Tax=Arachis TaxID=3817 RepID=A0A444YLB8_ARAHY|nr:uncharacterized protein LOC107491838 [Arachis duranensis]XP_016207491.1 uncharacterized protein LOC107647966 [Arachis ipaensis]XP_025663388.1 uncharacterized protein LOC112758826 [Arachis hypogaea]QHN85503.1 uncharacterized protein DS421_16g537980 [Arachis hypogaea]RYR02702.1 hypothetical protein Ahy_B06g081503 [Arachis hypogaea]
MKSTGRLPLLSLKKSPEKERSGSLTPPLETSASVPFRWEQVPGKPIPCTALIPFSDPKDFLPKCLHLPTPPARLIIPSPNAINLKRNRNRGRWFGSLKKKPFIRDSNLKRAASFSATSHPYGYKPRVWTTIYEGLKQVVPWKNKKLKDAGSTHTL